MAGRADDEEAFEAFVAARWHALVRAVVVVAADVSVAEEAVQHALVETYARTRRLGPPDALEAYVRTAAIRHAVRELQRRRRREPATPDLPDRAGDDEASAVLRRTEVQRLLRLLDPGQRAVLVLRFVHDLTEEQTARALGIRRGTVKSRQSRALAALRAAEAPHPQPEGEPRAV